MTRAKMRPAAERASRSTRCALPKVRIAVRQRDKIVLLRVSDIEWIEAAGNYARLSTRSGEFLLRERIGDLEQVLDPAHFARIHRSTIVNLDRVSEIRLQGFGDCEVVLIGGKRLRMSRHYRTRVL
jgi:two-component system, LytTR family, response regulator